MKNHGQIIKEALNVLKEKGSILYPTDTVWGIGCDALESMAINQIYNLKERASSKSLIVLVCDFDMLKDYLVQIPKGIEEYLETESRPTTVVYSHPKGFPINSLASDGSIAIRIVKDKFCQELIRTFGRPIVSTSANISGQITPMSFKEINPLILEKVDYIINLQLEQKANKSSKIIRYSLNGQVSVIRD
jgi:L-threonylcarbamoyladenylate synthase